MRSFEREHHRRIGRVLESLDAPRLESLGCLFGGGTAISLRCAEYRESVDIDFLISSLDGYRTLRQMLTGPDGFGVLDRSGNAWRPLREVRADQYGIRTLLAVDAVPIKFEVILEGRIVLDAPGPDDRICGVATLSTVDLAASKLLANSDRWRDDSTFSRDLIDLAMLAPPLAALKSALGKAQGAYGDSIQGDLANAVGQLGDRPQRLAACMRAMTMDGVSHASLQARIRRVAARIAALA